MDGQTFGMWTDSEWINNGTIDIMNNKCKKQNIVGRTIHRSTIVPTKNSPE